ncbi:ribosomal protein S18-alanine N-acetyltransferase [Methylophaga sp.]|uniref:ribosomal protein S18-alanine N-acetyltransferase n=1 Tax=Methylophaga sp. TaxID=2024840 RepID=UPI00271BAC43|nr:ribosomal protein S18-alanine N-acetyltransferase [Methylophaga sp.]MDO8825616.1 ribosomal protein S18-alanine N-acetyltransferase [Methylophaga sp.]
MTELAISQMQLSDIGKVWQMEKQANRFPWTKGNFEDCLKSGYRSFLYLVADEIIGFSVVQSVLDEVHLLNICVKPAFQGKGFGRQMLNHVIDVAHEQSASIIVLEVRASNFRAQQLYLSTGFNEMSVRRGYYPAEQGREDGVLMGLELGMLSQLGQNLL